MIYMGLRAIYLLLEVVLEVVVSAIAIRACSLGPSCRHSPSDKRNYTPHSQNGGTSANHSLGSVSKAWLRMQQQMRHFPRKNAELIDIDESKRMPAA
eukprot:4317224-Pleurochrysis_carterae.AAC.2